MEHLTTSLCRSCRQRLQTSNPARSFSSTRRRNIIPPESPNYVSVPQSLQENFHRTFPKKGFVPPPRDVFPRNTSLPEHIARIIEESSPDPKNPRPASELTEQQLYKRRMKEMRKQHYAEGLTQLYERKVREGQNRRDRSNALRAERARLISQTEREDARLTNVSTPKEMNANVKQDFSVDEARRMHDRKVNNVERRVVNKLNRQHEALHTLYMNARNFITTEEQLREKIKEEFDEKSFGGHARDGGKSYWDSQGIPDGVAAMVRKSTMGRGDMSMAEKEEAWRRDQQRMKRLAEGLSGGKM